ncbi:MAG: hypothetical protein JF606_19840 [Burkholderiales bacterium]|jgi:hypothetical protein|nr:hypothetical protein [Burkholderiales bacterium]
MMNLKSPGGPAFANDKVIDGAAFFTSPRVPLLTEVVREGRRATSGHGLKVGGVLAARPLHNGMLPIDGAGSMRLWNYEGTELPATLWHMREVQTLDLSRSRRLLRVSPAISRLGQLREFVLSGCSSLNELPEEIGLLEELRVLDLSRCSSLAVLPSSLGRLRQLQRLDLRGCDALAGVPPSITKLPQTCAVLFPMHLKRSVIEGAAGRRFSARMMSS